MTADFMDDLREIRDAIWDLYQAASELRDDIVFVEYQVKRLIDKSEVSS